MALLTDRGHLLEETFVAHCVRCGAMRCGAALFRGGRKAGLGCAVS